MNIDPYWLDWAHLLLRWAHVITAMAWIGASFYFVMLDNSLTPPEHEDFKAKGVDGELWAVHGGGFYHSQKYKLAPRWRGIPDKLHWSYWESYSTWLTGFALFTVLYLFNASSFLIDRTVFDWPPAAAIATALGFLVVFWLLYDGVCRSLGQGPRGEWRVAGAVLVLVVAAAWLACHLFAGRAAFLLVGAMLATAMSANVFFWIIPGQKKVIAALNAGQAPDPAHGQRGRQRSVHNTYFTLPVIVTMLSNHYGWLVQGEHNWVVLVLLMAAGALIRHSFVARHRARLQAPVAGSGPAWTWAWASTGALLLVGLAVWRAPAPPAAGSVQPPALPVSWMAVQAVLEQHCVLCHGAQVQNKNVALHTPELARQHALAIYQQVSVLKLMPMNNATQITPAERELIRRWFEAGAPVGPGAASALAVPTAPERPAARGN